MEEAVAKLMNDEVLKEAAGRFSCHTEKAKVLGDFENYVYEVHKGEEAFVLRLTHSSHRSTGMVEVELHWLNYLAQCELPVAKPFLSNNEQLVEVIEVGDSYFNVSLFEKAPGKMVNHKEGSDWGPRLFKEWGRTIGRIHKTTKDYTVPENLPKRLSWYEDDLLTDIERYLPEDQKKVVEKAREHVDYLKTLPMGKENYGLIHGDIHPGNFFFHNEKLTVFDFDDTMYHWFVSDIAIALYYSILSMSEGREAFSNSFMPTFLEGYRQENDLDQEWIARIPDFLRLRDITIYTVFYKKMDISKMNENIKALLLTIRDRIENNLPVVDIDFSQL